MDPAARATHGEKRALEASTGASEASEDESSGFDFDAAPVSAKAPARAPAATERSAPGATTSASAGQRPGAAATSDETVAGRGKQQSSRFYGVYYDCGRWRVEYSDEHGDKIYLAIFDEEEAAAWAYNAKIAELGLSHCRATNADIDGVLQPKPQTSSQHRGVGWDKTGGVWKVQVTESEVGLKDQSLGRYGEEISAANAYDRFLGQRPDGTRRRSDT